MGLFSSQEEPNYLLTERSEEVQRCVPSWLNSRSCRCVVSPLIYGLLICDPRGGVWICLKIRSVPVGASNATGRSRTLVRIWLSSVIPRVHTKCTFQPQHVKKQQRRPQCHWGRGFIMKAPRISELGSDKHFYWGIIFASTTQYTAFV